MTLEVHQKGLHLSSGLTSIYQCHAATALLLRWPRGIQHIFQHGNIKRIHPHTVMLYPIDRETPEKELIKLSKEELEKVKEKVEQLGIKTLIY